MVDKSETFLREVDEELRREQLRQLWDKYGILIAGAAVALLVGVWGFTHLQSRRAATAEAAGTAFETASRLIRDGKTDDAAKAFQELAKGAAPGYHALAQLKVAGLHAKAGRIAEAVAAYDALSKDPATDLILRDFAGLEAASLRLADADYAEMERRLTPLVADNAPWHSSARELLGLAAYKANKLDEARKQFELLLVDRKAPPGLNERVQLMLSVLTDADAAKAAAQPAAPAPAAAPDTEKTKDKSAPQPPAPKK